MAFWATPLREGQGDPKRKYRFTVNFPALNLDQSGILWNAKTVTKPSFTVTETDHTFLDKKYYYPGRLEWQTVAFTLVDPADGAQQDAVKQMNNLIQASGYTIPRQPSDLKSISKSKSNVAIGNGQLGNVVINQINAEGNPIETWTLNNAFVTEMKFGELDYTGDELIELSLTLRYDWAQCQVSDGTIFYGLQAPS